MTCLSFFGLSILQPPPCALDLNACVLVLLLAFFLPWASVLVLNVTALTFSLSDQLPLLFATTSLRSDAIQASLLYDRIKCPKRFSGCESLMLSELHADYRGVLLTASHDPSALCCSGMLGQQ